jgi:hypothetical protein
MKRIKILTGVVSLAILGSLALNACGAAATPESSPTIDIGAVQTSAVGTFAAGLTQTYFALPTDTPTPMPTDTPTTTTSLNTPLPQVGVKPAASCYGLAYVKDVTIPDNTIMAPGQTFTKTWRVRNSGTCAWEKGFKFAFVGGEAMDGATLTLDGAVNPGSEKDLSVAMKAPNKTGSVRGTWQMSTAGGTFFGDQMFLLINLGNGTTTITTTVTKTTTAATATKTATAATPTATVTTAAATATPTATATTPAPPTDTPTETPTSGT